MKKKVTKKVKMLLQLAVDTRGQIDDLVPRCHNPFEHDREVRQFRKDLQTFARIKDFKRVRGLEQAWEQMNVDMYENPNWRDEVPLMITDFERYFKYCQSIAQDYLYEWKVKKGRR